MTFFSVVAVDPYHDRAPREGSSYEARALVRPYAYRSSLARSRALLSRGPSVAERARTELLASGSHVRKRMVETRDDLTEVLPELGR
jgi:hypothetical protein